MTTTPHTDASITKDGATDATTPPGSMHGPRHGALDMAEIAEHDEVQHDAALRDSSLRVPR
ncbi:hypothetical protein DWU98_10855 [Dyella monticola]|uniref:Uncharacterized protein n=1 Tax=Dyella monticola TaxID=1927958 RepID=A0A370WZY7_9GAMM|nr:hypothetical protein [Dyella monticola]RDS81709.1 hypothetical protein DWU98_10855 [Dyella monticola]